MVNKNDTKTNNFNFQTLTYVAEITTPSLRGILASTSSVAVITGILTQFLLGTFFNWRTVALISCVLPITSFILLFFIPESPHWLISKNRLDDAQNSIAWLRGWVDEVEVEAEFIEMLEQLGKKSSTTTNNIQNQPVNKNNIDSSLNLKMQNLKRYGQKTFLWPFSLVCFTFLLGHFSGMTTLQTYAVQIFSTLQAPIDKYFATIFLGVAEVCGCILSACLVHYVGKRKMNFFSLIGCGCSFLIVATYAYLIGVHDLHPTNTADGTYRENWIPMTFLIAAAFFTHAGIRILPWMLVGEVYYSEIRATASGFSGAVSYILGFVSNKIFFLMINTFTLPGTYWFYSSVCFIGFILLYFVLPETEGKTLFEITEHFAGNDRMNNKVFISKRNKGVNGEINKAYAEEDQKESSL